MGFSAKQVQALRRSLDGRHVRTRQANGRELSYLEGWYAISEANRIFGFDGWSRETLESRCVLTRENRGTFLAVYTARVRITVQADGTTVIREGHGTGEGRGTSPGEVHDIALKAAETDATKRALATFGKPFGLELYRSGKRTFSQSEASLPPVLAGSDAAPRLGFHPVDKSKLTIAEPKRRRDKTHLKFVATQPCLICGRQPSDPHHLRFAQPRALGMKVSDEFTVPLCRGHHRQLHQAGNEVDWWERLKVHPLEIAMSL